MIISLIVAATENDVIGKENAIPWYLSADLVHFKQTTMGHPIIMGRRTYETIGWPLPGRSSIVITRQNDYRAEGCIVTESIERAIEEAKKAKGNNEIFFIGGFEIYNQALPLADKIYLTRVHTRVQGDKFFKFELNKWRQISSQKHAADENNQYDYEFITLNLKN